MRPEFRKQRFARSESGAIAVIWGLSLVVFFGFVALIFDIGRASATQSELQTFVDHVALAAASELDGKPDAINRATAAANNLINDQQTFARTETVAAGTLDRSLGEVGLGMSLRFLATLPVDDRDPITAAYLTTDPTSANFIEVTATPRSVGLFFYGVTLALLGDGDGTTPDAVLSATAVAGAGTEFCDVPPVFMCKPPGRSMTDITELGTMILLRSGSGASWGAGNFGWLDPERYIDPSGPCAGLKSRSQVIGCMVAAERKVSSCVSSRGIDTDPGQAVGIADAAFNVRFDMLEASMKHLAGPEFTSAPNTIAGMTPSLAGGICTGAGNGYSPSAQTVKLPVDASLSATNRFSAPGSDFDKEIPGIVSFEGYDVTSKAPTPADLYLAKNHPDTTTKVVGEDGVVNLDALLDNRLDAGYDISTTAGAFLQQQKGLYAKDTGGSAPLTRFEIYLREIANAESGNLLYSPVGPNGEVTTLVENGTGQCLKNPSADPFRRVIIAAEIDCDEISVKGKSKNIRPNGFVTLFLTEPVGAAGPSSFDMYVEVLGDAKVGIGGGAGEAGGKIRDVVRLFR